MYQAGIGLISILFIGTFGYWALTDGRTSLFNCFYMTVITITTIGFEEVIDMNDFVPARAFTIFLAFAGIGLLTYFVSSVSAVIIEGHLRESYKKRKMEKQICNMEKHFIICGISKHSQHLLEELSTTKRESVFIEIDKDKIKQVLQKIPNQCYIEGDSTHDEILLKAGLMKAKGLFAATNDDNINLVISLSAKRLNPLIKIVSLCINHHNTEKIKLAGADTIVSPNYIGGLRMASEMVRPAVTTFLDTMLRDKNKNLRIEQVDLDDQYDGKKITELNLKDYKNTLLIAVKSKDEMIFKPDDSLQLNKGDSLIVMTTPEERIELETIFQIQNHLN